MLRLTSLPRTRAESGNRAAKGHRNRLPRQPGSFDSSRPTAGAAPVPRARLPRQAAQARGRGWRFQLGASHPRALPGAESVFLTVGDARRAVARSRRKTSESKSRVGTRMKSPAASPDVAAHEPTARRRAKVPRAVQSLIGASDMNEPFEDGLVLGLHAGSRDPVGAVQFTRLDTFVCFDCARPWKLRIEKNARSARKNRAATESLRAAKSLSWRLAAPARAAPAPSGWTAAPTRAESETAAPRHRRGHTCSPKCCGRACAWPCWASP